MFKKIYEYIKDLITDNYKSFFVILGIYFVLMWPVDYYITTGGGTIDMKDRVSIKGSNKTRGSFNLAYVSELKGNVSTFLLSYIMPKWERVDAGLYKIDNSDDSASINYRNKLELDFSIDNAIKVAYTKANKVFTIKEEHLNIVYVSKESRSGLLVGDEILSVGGERISDLSDLKKIISTYSVGDKVTFLIKRNKKELSKEALVYKENKTKLVGISVLKSYDFETDPEIDLFFKETESGPSGGFMLSLDIYNRLISNDITKGYKIVGTGTISSDGSVGEISGVKYKLMGSVKSGADIFMVPSGSNYKEALREKKKNKYNIRIIGVKNIDGAIASLNSLPGKDKKNDKNK